MKNKIGLKELSDKELRERLDAEKMQLVKMKINHAVSPLENPNLIRVTRKNIARINTEITKRELNPVSSTNEEK
ncbi:MAG: 50S ribosomal protein L29 [Bacteroidales bacterium]|jgi:large subunit ribosomal protein L29|nr:50S ribosomal protein L29 [Bacteroidales bacterium]